MSAPLPPEIPGTRYVGIPPRFWGHPLFSGAPYFTLPRPLLERVVAEVGEERFDDELLQMEYALSDVCRDHAFQIGFWGGQPISFLLLRLKDDLSDDVFVQGLMQSSRSEAETLSILDLASQRLAWMSGVRRGYCGWLMTNRDFLDEHSRIFEAWGEQVRRNGIPQMGPVVQDAMALPGVQLAEGELGPFVRSFEEFFIRWRLEGMPAPFVPQPMGVYLPVMDLRPVLGHMREGGTTFYIPEIFPVPSRERLRDILEEVLRGRNAPDHLAEWFKIVHSDNVAKIQISHYARIFEIQHYFRALYARHATALERKKSTLMIALAGYLGVSDDSIERALGLIASRLGSDWYLGSA